MILDISNLQYEFKVYEKVYDCNLCNIKRRKSDFLQVYMYIKRHINKEAENRWPLDYE